MGKQSLQSRRSSRFTLLIAIRTQQRSWSVSGGTEVALWQKPAVEAEQIRLVDGACHLENVSLDDDSLQYTDTDVDPPRGYASFEGTLGFP